MGSRKKRVLWWTDYEIWWGAWLKMKSDVAVWKTRRKCIACVTSYHQKYHGDLVTIVTVLINFKIQRVDRPGFATHMARGLTWLRPWLLNLFGRDLRDDHVYFNQVELSLFWRSKNCWILLSTTSSMPFYAFKLHLLKLPGGMCADGWAGCETCVAAQLRPQTRRAGHVHTRGSKSLHGQGRTKICRALCKANHNALFVSPAAPECRLHWPQSSTGVKKLVFSIDTLNWSKMFCLCNPALFCGTSPDARP